MLSRSMRVSAMAAPYHPGAALQPFGPVRSRARGEHELHREQLSRQRVQHEAQRFEGHHAEKGRVARTAEDDRRRRGYAGDLEAAVGHAALDDGTVGERELSTPLPLEAETFPDRYRQNAEQHARVDDEPDVHRAPPSLLPRHFSADVGHAHEPDRTYLSLPRPVWQEHRIRICHSSALHHRERLEPRDPAREPGAVDDVHHVDDVLVRPRHLLRDAAQRLRAHEDAPLSELADEVEPAPGLLRLRPAHDTARAVARGAEGLAHGAL